jgi:NAD(P)-dependent dehydrogenase (short-subunit alcohol dehydrogenase family)
VSGPLLYLRPSEYRRQLEVNMISPLVVIQAFAPLMGTDKQRQGPTGRIVNITSRLAAPKLLSRFSALIAPPNLVLKECRTRCGEN